jgi:hypothetical protein
MRNRDWSRETAIKRVRHDIWRYVRAATKPEDILLQASALLDMPASQVRTLAQVQFVLSEPVRELLDDMPVLLRRLATTTVLEEERSAERVRGAIAWGRTISAQAASGLTTLYVTAPARRAFQTPENELLVFVLRAIIDVARKTGWADLQHRSPGAGRDVRRRHDDATRWLSARMLQDIDARRVTGRTVARVRSGRNRRRYRHVLAAYEVYRRLVARLDRAAVRKAVENLALVTSIDDKLFELLVAFEIERALRTNGWACNDPGLITSGQPLLVGHRNDEGLRVYYQKAPPQRAADSGYMRVQQAHSFDRPGRLRPDLLFRHTAGADRRWVLVEIKGGSKGVAGYAREATQNLLAYRQDLDVALAGVQEPYGLGVAWGAELEPSLQAPIMLCTPDTLAAAVETLFPQARDV